MVEASGLFEPYERSKHGEASKQHSITFQSMPGRDFIQPTFGPPCAATMFPLPFRLLLHDGAVDVPVCGQPTRVFVRVVRQDAFDKRSVIATTDGIELARDRAGVVRFTDIEVHMPYDVIRSAAVANLVGFSIREEPVPITFEWLDSLHDEVESIALFVINRLLRGYRLLSAEHFVRPITPADLFFIQTGWLMPLVYSPFKMAVGSPGQALIPEAHMFSHEFHNALADWLKKERDAPLWLELIQDAREYQDIGRYRQVVIDSRTALETYLDQTLLACFSKKQLQVADVAKILKVGKRAVASLSSIDEVLEQARLNDKLKSGLRAALSLEFGRRKFWTRWLRAKEMRERSVHYGQGVTADAARECLKVVEEMMNAIHLAGSPVSGNLHV